MAVYQAAQYRIGGLWHMPPRSAPALAAARGMLTLSVT